ncbi:hypothetical protein RQ831_22520 [Roseomonas gilardii]|uniref:Uncharacterized protein n=1 Tax=Roseomonas gilardii TaxID=257708 RepID=A0ABU3MLE3_9PROT|nr:hypothetical protein [Roseomonas gilardii]MDT8333833.1 hypothetical protein [Roseomonas gilardii]
MEGAFGEQRRIARHAALAAGAQQLAHHVGGAPAHELGVAAIPLGLVAGYGARGERLGHGVDQHGGVVVAGTGLRPRGHRGARAACHQRVEQGAPDLVGAPAALHRLGADRRDALGRQQGAGGLDGDVDAGDALALGPLRFGRDRVEVERGWCGRRGDGRGGHGGLLGLEHAVFRSKHILSWRDSLRIRMG